MAPPDELTIYTWWDDVPAHLKTKSALAKEHMKPGGPAKARIEYTAHKRLRSYELYDVGEAVKTVATPAQLAALEKARIRRCTCATCSKVVDLPSDLSKRTGRCAECRAKAAAAKRAKEVDATILWARSMLADPDALILDTETVDLHRWICEVGIIRMDGTIVFESLVNPLEKNHATHIHGISDQMCWDAPTFADVEPELRRLLFGKIVVVYNADYDTGVLQSEISRLCTPSDEAMAWLIDKDWTLTWGAHQWGAWDRHRAYERLISEQVRWWHDQINWECAMLEYSTYIGDWHDYYQDYRYQALGGGHRAVGDCRACLEVIRRMAATPLSTEQKVEEVELGAPA